MLIHFKSDVYAAVAVVDAKTPSLDSRTRVTTSTRFDLKFFRVFSKYRLPRKLHFTIFH